LRQDAAHRFAQQCRTIENRNDGADKAGNHRCVSGIFRFAMKRPCYRRH
jgi:hypothetical protein